MFDFDGTLVRSEVVKTRAFYDVFPPEVRPIVEHVRAADRYADRFTVIEHVLRQWRRREPSREDIAGFADAYNNICELHQKFCPERPGASRILGGLSAARRPLYLCSGTLEESLRRIVAARGWTGYFRGILGGPVRKREVLSRVAGGESCSFREILVVGDTRDDLEAARACGCVFRGIRSEVTDFDETEAVLIGDLEELEHLC
ncbi:MAG: HAD family hydrolase [Planctomycetes bacterium]|nr:HAD family hydrolase [Planctomycetota bacterium]